MRPATRHRQLESTGFGISRRPYTPHGDAVGNPSALEDVLDVSLRGQFVGSVPLGRSPNSASLPGLVVSAPDPVGRPGLAVVIRAGPAPPKRILPPPAGGSPDSHDFDGRAAVEPAPASGGYDITGR
jgi:hypothetical protein